MKDLYTRKRPIRMNEQQMKPKSSEREDRPLRDVSLNSYHESSENSCNSWNEGLSTSRDPGAGECCPGRQPPVPELCRQLSLSVCDSGQGTSDIQKKRLAKERSVLFVCPNHQFFHLNLHLLSHSQLAALLPAAHLASEAGTGRQSRCTPSPGPASQVTVFPNTGRFCNLRSHAAVPDALVKLLGAVELKDQ